MATSVVRICRYPVKGLSAEDLDRVMLNAGQCLPQDRRFALAHAATHFDRTRPAWLPCFVDSTYVGGRDPAYLNAIAGQVLASGLAWISTTTIGKGVTALRACVTNYKTQREDVDILVAALQSAREQSATFAGDQNNVCATS